MPSPLPSSRRRFLRRSATLAAPALLAAGHQPSPAAEATPSTPARLRVVCVGGHPDDPESGCAGTLARYAALGHTVTVVYLTRGERGIEGKTNEEAARIRSAECEAACRVMGGRPVFAGQTDGSTEFNRAWVERMTRLLADEKPDVVFTHWPLDTHMDHQVASLLTQRACLALRPRPALFFFEVNTGSQSQGFLPNVLVDVTPVLERKKQALLAHASQDGSAIWREHHEIISQWRGREAGVAAAEAFVHLTRNTPASRLPGL